jgi:hypothetical protein
MGVAATSKHEKGKRPKKGSLALFCSPTCGGLGKCVERIDDRRVLGREQFDQLPLGQVEPAARHEVGGGHAQVGGEGVLVVFVLFVCVCV